MKKGKIVFTIRELIFLVTAILLFFQVYLQKYFGVLQYFDEMVTVVLLFRILATAVQGKMDRTHIKMLCLMVLVMIVGLVSNINAGIQTGMIPILTDIGNCFKVFVVYIGSSIFLKRVYCKARMVSRLSFVVKWFVVVAFLFMMLHELGIVVMGEDMRFGMISFRFINGNAGVLSLMFYSITLILTLRVGISASKRKNMIVVLMALAVWASTLRARALAFIAIYVILYWMVIVKEQKPKMNLKNTLVSVAVVLIVCMDKIGYYFTSTRTARANFLKYGVKTMLRYFPLGSGFATFGTDAAMTYYSELYVEYGFSNIWGLSTTDGRFGNDTYWPAIFAQFGIIGTILMAILIYTMCKDILKKAEGNKYRFFSAMFVIITQVTSSVATATFFHFVTVGLFFLVPLLFDETQQVEKKGNRIDGTSNRIYPHV